LKAVLFFSCEPGGAEVLIPVIRLVKEKTTFKVIVLGYGYGEERIAKKQIPFIAVGPIARNDAALIERHSPDFVITSATSLPSKDMSEKHLWRIAANRRIPSLAFIDQWQNYAMRFSGPRPEEKLAYMPSFINCLNEIGRMEMISKGFDAARLLAFGHPYLTYVKAAAVSLKPQELKRSLDIKDNQMVVLFVSEAIKENYGNERGYDQYEALELLLISLGRASKPSTCIIKLHPKDDKSKLYRVTHKFPDQRMILIENELDSLECLVMSDVVYGMTSIMLIEGYILGKKVVSLQPNVCGEDPLVLSRLKMIPVVTSPAMMDDLRFVQNEVPRCDYEFKEHDFVQFLHASIP